MLTRPDQGHLKDIQYWQTLIYLGILLITDILYERCINAMTSPIVWQGLKVEVDNRLCFSVTKRFVYNKQFSVPLSITISLEPSSTRAIRRVVICISERELGNTFLQTIVWDRCFVCNLCLRSRAWRSGSGKRCFCYVCIFVLLLIFFTICQHCLSYNLLIHFVMLIYFGILNTLQTMWPIIKVPMIPGIINTCTNSKSDGIGNSFNPIYTRVCVLSGQTLFV